MAKQSLLLCLIKRVKEGFRKYQGCHEFNYSTSVVVSCDNAALILQLLLHVSEMLDILHEKGILHVLGLRGTVESITGTPPASSKLMKSFITLQYEKSKLTV